MKDILITSSVLILTILLIRFFFRSTIARRAQYALWLLVALRLLVPANLPAIEHNVLSVAEQTETIQNIEALRGVNSIEHMASGAVEGYDRGRLMPETPVTVAENVAPERFERMETTLAIRNLIEPLWYGGMAVMALWFLAANLRFARRLRRTRVAVEEVESRYPVYLCDDIPSPCLFGLFRPAIYVTSEAAKDENRLRCVIAHEETHARHLDPLWSLLRGVCLVVYWFDPLVWLAAYCSKADCELACDEGALSRLGEPARTPYGETLLALIPVQRGKNPMLTATTMTAGKRQMKERIRRIAEHKRPVAVALVLVLALSGIACAATFTGAERHTPAEVKTPAAEQIAAPADAASGETAEPAALFSTIAGEYWFLSGAGGWHSALFLNEDGSFSGEFLDGDANVTYYCDFRGRFGDVCQIDDFTYAMRLLELTAMQTEGEELGEQDGVRYVGASPYGMEDTEEFLIYLPGKPVNSLSEEFRSWYDRGFSWAAPYSDTLDTVGLCNAVQQYGWFPAKLIGADDASRLRSLMESVYTADENGNYAPISLWLYTAGGESAVESIDNVDARLVSNFPFFMHYLFDRPDVTLEPSDLPWTNADVIELRLPSTGDRLLFWEGENYVRWLDGSSAERGFLLTYGDGETVAGDLMRDWYDEAEISVLRSSCNADSIIPDHGQTYLEAAQEYCERSAKIPLMASEGSAYKDTFARSTVSAAAEETANFRAQGRIDENTWCFFLTKVFVPENERALRQSMAGNTENYTGSDPDVPDGAYVYYRCGYAHHEPDGWRCEVVGTGW
ncbi:MAG: M56 family metallopeptidase [Ruminococcaceae bacterium]|nr:M56 family metallopeptidase [Oscillospiraceae bacterium]